MLVSHAQNPGVLRRARDLYAVYCASSDGKNYQGLPCPAWDKLTDAVRGHWYAVAKRTLDLQSNPSVIGDESKLPPSDYTLGHLSDPAHAFDVWREYSGYTAGSTEAE